MCACSLAEKLSQKFEPTSNIALNDLKTKFNEHLLEIGKDPNKWILELECIKYHMEKDFKKVMLEND